MPVDQHAFRQNEKALRAVISLKDSRLTLRN